MGKDYVISLPHPTSLSPHHLISVPLVKERKEILMMVV